MEDAVKMWDDASILSFLIDEFDPLKTDEPSSINRSEFWKDLLIALTLQRSQSIFTVESLERRITDGNPHLPWLNSIVKDLCKDKVFEPLNNHGWVRQLINLFFNTDNEIRYVNIEALQETCRAVQTVIKNQYFQKLDVPYDYLWKVCRKTCEGNEDLFKLVLARLPHISVKGDIVKVESVSDLNSGPCYELREVLHEVRLAIIRMENLIANFESSKYVHNKKRHEAEYNESLEKNSYVRPTPIHEQVLFTILGKLRNIDKKLDTPQCTKVDQAANIVAALRTVETADTVIQIVKKAGRAPPTTEQENDHLFKERNEHLLDRSNDMGIFSDCDTSAS